MTGDKRLFTTLQDKQGGTVTFGNNGKGKVMGMRNVGKCSSTSIEHVFLVEGLKHNLLSISQLCDKRFKVIFETSQCLIVNSSSNETKFTSYRERNVYVIHLNEIVNNDVCLQANNFDISWLWHKRLAHARMRIISKLTKGDLVRGLPKGKYALDHVCDTCVKENQTRAAFKSKNERQPK